MRREVSNNIWILTREPVVEQAVATAPVEHPSEDGMVLAVVKEGYAIGDEVLRPASVVVGQHAGQA